MIKRLGGICLLVMASVLHAAELTIEITQGSDNPTSIAVVPLGTPPGLLPSVAIDAIVSADLERSGLFAPLKVSEMIAQPHEQSQVFYNDWRLLGTDYLVNPEVTVNVKQYRLRIVSVIGKVNRPGPVQLPDEDAGQERADDVARPEAPDAEAPDHEPEREREHHPHGRLPRHKQGARRRRHHHRKNPEDHRFGQEHHKGDPIGAITGKVLPLEREDLSHEKEGVITQKIE